MKSPVCAARASRTRQRFSRQLVRWFALVNDQHPVDHNVRDPVGELVWLSESGAVGDSVKIENGQIRSIARLQ